MTDKQQHTAFSIHERMLLRYDDGLHHKHDKSHVLPYRKHCRSHPVIKLNRLIQAKDINESTGIIQIRNLQKIRKRFDKGRYH
jgi:hypothetical protein